MSLENPTQQFLNENFTKPQLQKHCRDIGLTKIWVNKEQLVEMILEKHNATASNTRSNDSVEEIGVVRETTGPPSSLRGVLSDIRDIKEKLAVKDMEIDDLYEKLRKSQDIISRQQEEINHLDGEIKRLRTSRKRGDEMTENQPSDIGQPTGTLLLGDANLSYITSSDLNNESSIRTISEANLDLLRSWVTEKLEWIPSRCIIYGGISDIQENNPPSDILDNLTILIGDLKSKNADMDIYVCQLAPSLISDELQAKINEYNDALSDYCSTNNIRIINCNLPFKIATGELDEMCFNINKDNNCCILNRLGAIRLLDCIAKKCQDFKLCDNWTEVKRNHTLTKFNDVNNANNLNNRIKPELRNIERSDYRNNQHNSFPNRKQFNNNENRRNTYSNRKEYDEEFPRYSYLSRQNKQHSHPSGSLVNHQFPNNERVRNGCFNCGEFNHQQSQCRYDHKIRCELCHLYGHKRRLCPRYNE